MSRARRWLRVNHKNYCARRLNGALANPEKLTIMQDTFCNRLLGIVIALAILNGCASNPPTEPTKDPWEGFNRGVTSFNNGADKVLIKPLAKGYRFVTPDLVERGVSNVFSNLGYPAVAFNNLLQGKGKTALADTGRFLINSTIGVAGIFDVASTMGLEENNEGFGQTLATWGVPSGPYLVLPFLGPSTLRGAFGLPVDQALDMRNYLNNTGLEDKLLVLQIISIRAGLLPLDEQIEAANDPYIFVREAYLQRQNFLIYDGEPPEDEEEFEIEDDFDADL
ncbi:MAG: VacJ family lipoprotein [Pseudomonadota bacterium]